MCLFFPLQNARFLDENAFLDEKMSFPMTPNALIMLQTCLSYFYHHSPPQPLKISSHLLIFSENFEEMKGFCPEYDAHMPFLMSMTDRCQKLGLNLEEIVLLKAISCVAPGTLPPPPFFSFSLPADVKLRKTTIVFFGEKTFKKNKKIVLYFFN